MSAVVVHHCAVRPLASSASVSCRGATPFAVRTVPLTIGGATAGLTIFF